MKIKDLINNPPVYHEEDIHGLYVQGKNVYSGEKKHLMNMLDELLTVEWWKKRMKNELWKFSVQYVPIDIMIDQ